MHPTRPAPAPDATDSPWRQPVCSLGLRIEGSPIEPVLADLRGELDRAGLHRLRPKFYLSTEWGVVEGTVAVAIPFYLARPDLTALHLERVGHVEGVGREDLLRYLRHEVGHVVNYAYRLSESPEWVDLFGPMDRPYLEEYTVEPFSRRFVRHLPGWYAQKHPDEDWSETFAVWLTPGLDWRLEYEHWPEALAKLQYCDRTMAAVAGRDPPVTADQAEGDVSELAMSVEEFYGTGLGGPGFEGALSDAPPPGLDAALRSLFPASSGGEPASALIRRLETALTASVYQWTGHFPERTRPLLRHLAARADALGLRCPPDEAPGVTIGLTALVTTLAMNHVQRGAYLL